MNFEINNRIKMLNQYSNLDALYGPYDSVPEACAAIPVALRGKGLTVGIENVSGNIEEYWWCNDTSDSSLIKKIEQVDLTIAPNGSTIISVDEGQPVVLGPFSISGRASISKCYLYEVVGGYEVFKAEYTNIAKGDSNYIPVDQSFVSGVYTYRIKVVDSSGSYAKTVEGDEYIEYEVRYGGISIEYNFTNFERIKIKNVQSIAGQYFTATINVRDDSFHVLGVNLTNNNDVSISLPPYDSPTEPGHDYLGLKYYIMPDEQTLSVLNGQYCYVEVVYTEGLEQHSSKTGLFTLLDITSLELISQSAEKTYYVNFPDYYTFQFKSGVDNLSVYVSQGSSSDFVFEPVTVTSYNNYSLRIVPANISANAILQLQCAYTVNNVQYTKTFTLEIGDIQSTPARGYFQPDPSDVRKLATLVTATEDDFVERNVEDKGTVYYKIENDYVSDSINTCAAIIDISCKINQVNNKNLKYVRIMQGNVEIGSITEDNINCNGILTDTPLNKWVQIAIGYNIKESITRNNQTVEAMYHAIYINGMIVKNAWIGQGGASALVYDPEKPITVELSNGICVQKCMVYYSGNAAVTTINPKAVTYSIIYTNFLAHYPIWNEPGNLPVLKLLRYTNAQERLEAYNLVKKKSKKIKHLTTFGQIGMEKADKMATYDSNYGDHIVDHDGATLFRQSVNIKKPAQKEYATLCKGQWMVNGTNILEGCIVEVHTQGTSTLVYAVPNFKFTFWRPVGNTVEEFYPDFIQKPDGTYYQEYIYTAKADFMDSSHLNNTPTCVFYNDLIQDLIEDDVHFPQFDGSPSAAEGDLDAIKGFPIVLEISDNAQSMSDLFVNIGSFMLNIDKTGDSLGFEVDGQSCLSFEGTSNDNEHGAAGRFIIPDGLTLKNYLNPDGTVNEAAIEYDYNQINDAIEASLDGKISTQAIVGGDTVENHPYVKWSKFLSDGLEYRYPDGDIYKESGSSSDLYVEQVMDVDDFKKLYKMWIWVNNSDQLTDTEYRSQFENHFDLYYCMLYFIQVMIFGQTDNLGKNAMFDCWDGTHWYPRPYDLDSQAGLDNNGNDNVAAFVEIKPEFSLNWDSTKAADYEWRSENYLLDEDIKDPITGEVIYPASTITYGGQIYDRYHYSSNTSKLWITFYKNYQTQIEGFYSLLRNNGYTPDTVINLCKDLLIDQLGVNQYNQDFTNKYLATKDQNLAYGNRWDKFKKWITQRFAFCDSYFNAAEPIEYNLVSSVTYTIEVECPQYVTQQYQSNSIVKFIIDKAQFQAGSGAATKFTLRVTQPQVLNTTLFKYVSLSQGTPNFINVIGIDVSYNRQISNIENIAGSTFNNLKTLNINNSAVNQLTHIPTQLKTLNAENVTLSSISFPQNCLVETIDLKGATINTDIDFNMLPNLKTLDLTGCTINGNITLASLPDLDSFITTNAKFNGNIIISNNVKITEFDFSDMTLSGLVFQGTDINITKLNFHNTTFSQNTINFNAISKNIQDVYFNGCRGLEYIQLTSGITFQSLDTFSLTGSSIVALGADNTKFDASHFNNIAQLHKASFNSLGVVSKSQFTFEQTKITDIINLSWTGTGYHLFYLCQDLVSVGGTLNISDSADYMFWRCSALTTLPTINISTSVTTAQYMLAGTNLLTYSDVEGIIRKCTKVENFTGALWCKDLPDNTTVNLTRLFENNTADTLNLTFMFGAWNRNGGIPSVTNNIEIVGYLPSNTINITRMFNGSTGGTDPGWNILKLPYDVLNRATNLENLTGTFVCSQITFYKQPGSTIDLPTYIDEHDVTVTATDEIDSDFFPTKEEVIGGQTTIVSPIQVLNFTFQGSNIQPNNTGVFRTLYHLIGCQSCFKGSHSGQFRIELDVTQFWKYCPNIIHITREEPLRGIPDGIAGCFSNVKNVTCFGLQFHNDITSNDTVIISGLFGLDGSSAGSSAITINFSNIVPKIVIDYNYSTDTNTIGYAGTFQNRTVNILDTGTTILSNVAGLCRRMFMNSKLIVDRDSNITTFDLSNVTGIAHMFYGCSIYYIEQQQEKRKFVNVLLPSSCADYSHAFDGSYVLDSLPALASSATSTTSYMFASCVINKPQVQIPADYFQICKNNITDVTGMFYGNQFITELLYNSSVGLFSDCVNLLYVDSMFENAYYLHKGIPTNLFGTTPLPKITRLRSMFKHTSIFFDVEDDSNRWVTSNTIAPLTKLDDIQDLFSYIRIGNNQIGYIYKENVLNGNILTPVISGDTFINHNLVYIRRLFMRSSIIKDTPFAFLSFVYGEDAFNDCSPNENRPFTMQIANPFITDSDNLVNIRNISRMFGMPTAIPYKTVTNLGYFINPLSAVYKPIMNNAAGNLANTDIDDTSLLDDFNEDVNYGHSLIPDAEKRPWTQGD